MENNAQNVSLQKCGDMSMVRIILYNIDKKKGFFRVPVDETLFVIKWHTEPTFIENGTVIPSLILTHSEALTEMATAAWSEPVPVD